jgi:hypothetical protein
MSIISFLQDVHKIVLWLARFGSWILSTEWPLRQGKQTYESVQGTIQIVRGDLKYLDISATKIQ